MSKFTPGPWEIVGATHVWSPSEKANIASCSALRTISYVGYAPPDIGDIDETAANARLIAAAPEMAELLARYLKTADSPLGMSVLADLDSEARSLLARINK
ncbi:hypothetical protein M0Q28_06830 [Patescibacteria group bacterium]|jgi:hypothetical protein|nr:hypothetical protein [Patescibacteria group bacterium]